VLIDAEPEKVIEQIKASKLRGRGGAGFLTGSSGNSCARPRATGNTSFATPMRATPAPT